MQPRNPWKAPAVVGVPVEVTEFPGWKFMVRPADKWNADYQRALVRVALRPEMRKIMERQAADDYVPTADDLAADADAVLSAFVEGCVAGWSGVTGPDGEPMAFAPGNVKTVLSTFPKLFDALERVAKDPANFVEPDDRAKVEAIVGNFAGASSSKPARGAKPSRSSRAARNGASAPRL